MKKTFLARNRQRPRRHQARDLHAMTDPAILASLKNIEALLTKLVEKQRAEITHPHPKVDEEISLVLQQGIDPVSYLKARQAKQKNEQP